MVDQFGVTLHGNRNPIGYYVREDFNEPRLPSYVSKPLAPEVQYETLPL